MQYRYRRRQERGPVPDVDNKQGAGNGCIGSVDIQVFSGAGGQVS